MSTEPRSLGHLNRRMFYDNTYLPAAALNYMQYQHEINMQMLVQPYTPGVLSGLTVSSEEITPGSAVLQGSDGKKTFLPILDPLQIDTTDLADKVGQQLLLTYRQAERGSITTADTTEVRSEFDERIPELQWWDGAETSRPMVPFCVLYNIETASDDLNHPDNVAYSSDFVFNASSEYRQTAFCNVFPIGTIIPFSGDDWHDDKTIPGWYVCEGQDEGIPDLRARFLMGAYGQSHPQKTADDSTSGSYSGGIGSMGGENQVSLTEEQLPDHTHRIVCNYSGSHNHSYTGRQGWFKAHRGSRLGGDDTTRTETWYGNGTWSTVREGSHIHIVSIRPTPALSGDPIENRPAFYSIQYIMRRY